MLVLRLTLELGLPANWKWDYTPETGVFHVAGLQTADLRLILPQLLSLGLVQILLTSTDNLEGLLLTPPGTKILLNLSVTESSVDV